ncbi:MAG: carboxypeptidase regulatory-like domain-containing protein [Proteobacteria bacterium]|nr:carboxypeptidase regulatory-like domain-containing protein [Pseudomonadota bacterium]
MKISSASGQIRAESKNTAVAKVSLSNVTTTGATLKVYGVSAGVATVYVRDAMTPSISLPVTVVKAMTLSPTSVSLAIGASSKLTASNYSGAVSAASASTSIATASVSGNVVTVKGIKAGNTVVSVKDSKVTVNVPVTVGTSTVNSSWVYKILATNDLGMHCVDADFSVFSILPPYNVVNAQVVRRASTGKPVVVNDSLVTLHYQAVRDLAGSINSSSLNSTLGPKTNFWTYAPALFGVQLLPGQGLKGLYMPADTTTAANRSLAWNTAGGLFKAEGVPITPKDDAGLPNRYPLMRLVATEKATGKDVAYLDVVLPVSEETTCSDCHDLGGTATRRTGITWSAKLDKEVRTRENVLLLHDKMNTTNLMASKPVLCAGCHYSPALDLAGTGPAGAQVGKPTMSSAMHAYHSTRMQGFTDDWVRLGGTPSSQTQACYTCHPGRNTKCLRGAMTETVNCQNCHGKMAAVGGMSPLKAGGSIDGTNDLKPRRPWKDLPRCQSCHTGDAVSYLRLDPSLMASDGLRTNVAFDPTDASASPRLASNKRFAENSGQLFRFSKGHSGIACEACHNSTHAIWANPVDTHNDNVAAKELQGHTGTVAECSTCHAPGSLALTLNGPHGMHNVGDSRWTSGHESLAQANVKACAACHGPNYRGTVLSRTAAVRTWSTEFGTRTVPKGQVVGCYDCHNGPNP